MPKKMMPNMETYGGQNNPGYKPPTGSAGSAARGEYSHKSNPLSVPRKGSQIYASGDMGRNGDREKVLRMEKEQEKNEKLRGQGC